MTILNAGLPKIINEKVLAVRGNWLIKGRIVVYHNQLRRAELFIEIDPKLQGQSVGLVEQDLVEMHNLLQKYKQDIKEI